LSILGPLGLRSKEELVIVRISVHFVLVEERRRDSFGHDSHRFALGLMFFD
jgi:hypothetical protein